MNRLREGIRRLAGLTGGLNYKKLGLFAAIAVVMYYVVTEPNESANLVQDAFGGVGDAAGALAEFLRSLVR
jgi:hypothetical protein